MNKMEIKFYSKSDNESFARTVAAAFILEMDPTIEELSEIKTAVSEAVTNSIIHGYCGEEDKLITMSGEINNNVVKLTISDEGRGIEDIAKAMEPMFTGRPQDERSGMGFTIMESFMDSIDVQSCVGKGTTVTMTKKIGVFHHEG